MNKEIYYKFFLGYPVDSFEQKVNLWIAENANEISIIEQHCELDHRGKVIIVIEYTTHGSD
ncbi:hypothetical protein [Macrococcoides caseolyticum]|uniref:Uncharacterized protein n=1 Tax=Macrococcoides caseolyticum TaxID=69966 RepID=A0ACC9MSR3_9STAP|nr:hypothetical protein [Macrococcus caseolyticus]PKE40468.1 hypothetical protein CW675_01795 [Macrococcus caseolyticus]PKE56722.1 hypothetical protein CW682_05850 [Macrococcus caseolyticus]